MHLRWIMNGIPILITTWSAIEPCRRCTGPMPRSWVWPSLGSPPIYRMAAQIWVTCLMSCLQSIPSSILVDQLPLTRRNLQKLQVLSHFCSLFKGAFYLINLQNFVSFIFRIHGILGWKRNKEGRVLILIVYWPEVWNERCQKYLNVGIL